MMSKALFLHLKNRQSLFEFQKKLLILLSEIQRGYMPLKHVL